MGRTIIIQLPCKGEIERLRCGEMLKSNKQIPMDPKRRGCRLEAEHSKLVLAWLNHRFKWTDLKPGKVAYQPIDGFFM